MIRLLTVAFGLLLVLGILSVIEFRHDRAGVVRAETDIKLGERVYLENCAACHGDRGDGKGPQAHKLKTRPRDFTTGNYKFRSTPSGSLPLDEDIFRTVSRGVRGTSMLAQLHLSEKERWSVTEYLKTFSNQFKTEKPLKPIPVPAQPSPDARLIALGRSKYTEAGCNQCHGPEGKGDGTSARELKDDWGEPISPTDLTLKPFKSGPNPEDLYRTISTGLNGTPMPSYADVLTPRERRALAFYILSIATRERPRGMMGLVGEETQGMMIDMRAAMAVMMGGGGMMGRGGGMMDRNMHEMMDRNMHEMMKDMMGR